MLNKTFVSISNKRFTKDGEQIFIYSANYWQAMNMGSNGQHGNRKRLLKDLDRMKEMQVVIINLNILEQYSNNVIV
jgi:mannan endo-1,4-beta-mannosidase